MALNSPNDWLFDEDDLEHTPSRADGISYEEEMYQRAHGIDLIVRVGSVRIAVPALTVATASVFLHRFYMVHSLKQFPSREVAMACLFLAGKVEESLRKVEAVVNYLLRLEDRRKGKEPDVHPSNENFRRMVQQVLYIEELILVALQFDMTVEHPHPLLSRALKRYESSSASTLSLEHLTALGRASWQILSDMYTIPLCICFPPAVLAAASFLLAWQSLSNTLPALSNDWTASFDIDWDDHEEVAEVDSVIESMTELWSKARNEKTKAEAGRLKQIVPKATSFTRQAQKVVKQEDDMQAKTEEGANGIEQALTGEKHKTDILAKKEEEPESEAGQPDLNSDTQMAWSPVKAYDGPPTP